MTSRWGKIITATKPIEEEEKKVEKDITINNNDKENNNDDDDVAKTQLSSEKKQRKRKNRWETAQPTTTTLQQDDDDSETPKNQQQQQQQQQQKKTNNNAPLSGTIIISGGLRVQIPATLTGIRSAPDNARDDPELMKMFEDLEKCNRNALIGLPFREDIFCDGRDVLKTKNSKFVPKEVEDNFLKPKDDAPPVYDAQGHRVSSKSELHKDKYDEKRGRLIEEIARKCSQFTPPADYLPSRKRRKIYIPVEEHPGYNFFGLIIGPRGNTQKKMQMETNTKIVIRGRGAVKQGSGKQDVSIDEPLHVLVEGDTIVDLDHACDLIEKLLVPVAEDNNEHKREQLRQLAIMNGTLRDVDEQELRLQQEEENALLYQLPDHIKAKTDEMYLRDMERVHGSNVCNGIEDKYSDFLSEIGVDPSSLAGGGGAMRGVSYADADKFNPSNAKISGLGAGAKSAPASAGATTAAAQTGGNPDDKNKLYVANLPPHVTNEQLRPIFEKFGRVIQCDVVPDREKNTACKGFAFVTYATEVEARSAIPPTNGMTIEGRIVETRIKNEPKVPINNAGSGGHDTAADQEDVNEDAKLYVANLPTHYEDEDLKTLFGPYGLVQNVKLVIDHSTGMSRGYGFVQMMDQEQAMSAIMAVHGNMVEGCTKPLVVNIASERKKGNVLAPTMMIQTPYMFASGLVGGEDGNDAAAITAAYYYQQQQQMAYYQQWGQQQQYYEVGDMNEAPPPPPEIPPGGDVIDVPPPPRSDIGAAAIVLVPPPPSAHGVIADAPPPPPLP